MFNTLSQTRKNMTTEQWNVHVPERDNSRKADSLSPTLEAWTHKPLNPLGLEACS